MRNKLIAVSLCTFITLDGVLKSFGMAGKKERDQLPQTVYQKMRESNVYSLVSCLYTAV
jgi:hypothetical protein